ncbi:MAG TPA: T9SS type A sorting domain-containing protein [Bacteroidales bacterium]|nr:T9SS type A sorting domain-containing protein [Bacteroidales bacterium]
MKQILLLVIFLFPVMLSKAQLNAPGGVKGLYMWNTSRPISGERAVLQSRIYSSVDSVKIMSGKACKMNNNPAVLFNGNTQVLDTLFNLNALVGFSLFTVCQQVDTLAEQVIFSMENDTSTEMVLTNRRLASLSSYQYANYNGNLTHIPRIYVYSQNNRADSSATKRRLRFGQVSRAQHLPVSAFNGIVSEMILFNRNLSYTERVKTESYLAIKYGISLSQQIPTHYLNSKGDIIWNADLNASYAQNIAGIGRDDVSGLNQTITESLQTPGLMKISSSQTLPDNSFLIWGDNGGEARFLERNGIPKCLGRDWKVSAFNTSGLELAAQTDVLAFQQIDPLASNEIYWMMIDRSGTGAYPFGQTEYTPCHTMESARKVIQFNKIVADRDKSGSDVFTVIAMPALFSRSIVISPDCKTNAGGSIQTEIAGGEAPFSVKLKSLSNSGIQKVFKINDRICKFSDVLQGGYVLEITDAKGVTYNETVWVSNAHLWNSAIEKTYTLREGEQLELDASQDMAAGVFAYQWITPEGENFSGEKISIDRPGTYQLTVNQSDGCNVSMAVHVQQTSKSDIEKAEVFPNPVSQGWFAARVSLKEEMDITLTLSAPGGQFLKEEKLQHSRYYWYNGTLTNPGIYFLTITTANSRETMKIIVQ